MKIYDFFRVIIAVDETWMRYTESMEWKHPQSPIKRKLNIQPTASKVMFYIYTHTYIHTHTKASSKTLSTWGHKSK